MSSAVGVVLNNQASKQIPKSYWQCLTSTFSTDIFTISKTVLATILRYTYVKIIF